MAEKKDGFRSRGAATATLHVPMGPRSPYGDLFVPPAATGAIMVLADSGEGEPGTQIQLLLLALQRAGLATLLVRSTGAAATHIQPERTYVHRRVQQLLDAVQWTAGSDYLSGLSLGYMGRDMEAVAAMHAAAAQPDDVGAIVLLDGILDVAASDLLERVKAPTLLVTGSELSERRDASGCSLLSHLRCPHDQARVPGVSHPLQTERSAAEAARLTCAWFNRHLAGVSVPTTAVDDVAARQPSA